MNCREKTRVALGPVEAYAKDHRRVAPVVGTAIRLSVEEAGGARSTASPLRQMTDGAPLDMEALRQLLPSLGSVTWEFSGSIAASRYELSTVADDIKVKLYTDVENGLPEIDAESKLRGIAARPIVELEYGG